MPSPNRQYQKILSSRDLFMSDTNYDSLQYQRLLCRRGSPRADRFFAAAFLFGGFMILLFEKKRLLYPRLFHLPASDRDSKAVLLCLFFQMPYFLTRLICGVQHGQLFPNLTKHVLSPLHLSGTPVPVFGDCFFPLLFVAFLLGTIAAGCLRSKQEFREHSLLIRYWRKL